MRRKTVLVVDKEPDVLMLIQRSLSIKKLKVWEANSGNEALELFTQHQPDLVLLDILLPDMDGFEVCRRIKSHPHGQKVPVIFLSVRAKPEDIARGKALGADAYFIKPFDPFELAEKIVKFLE